MTSGLLFALAAGLMWGLVFVGPLLLPEYPAALQSFGRYLAFGLIALPLAWLDRTRLRGLTRADWREAFRLSLVGNIVYYLFLASAIQRSGGPLPTMIIGTLPVVIAITANLRAGGREARLPWLRLLPSLALIAAGSLLIALTAQVAIPLPFSPVPVTGQTFGVLFVASMLGRARGTARWRRAPRHRRRPSATPRPARHWRSARCGARRTGA